MKQQTKIIKLLIASNIILAIIVILLGYYLNLAFLTISANSHTANEYGKRVLGLDMYLRNKGLVDGELNNPDVKPYSIEELEDFQKWYNEQQQDNSEN